MTDRKTTIAVELMKIGYSSAKVIKEMRKNNIELTKNDVKEIKSIARGNGLK